MQFEKERVGMTRNGKLSTLFNYLCKSQKAYWLEVMWKTGEVDKGRKEKQGKPQMAKRATI